VQTRRAEQRATVALDELRATAPAFVEQARVLAAKERYDEALEKLDYALKLRPDDAEVLLAKGDLLLCQLELSKAATVYHQAARAKPGFARAQTSATLCDELLAAPSGPDGKLSRESLAKLYLEMQRQQRPRRN
jgi:tetratricopeptide (TPR) repeat protein